jgi:hypothetical protein
VKPTPTREPKRLRIDVGIGDLLDKYTVFEKSVKTLFKTRLIATI